MFLLFMQHGHHLTNTEAVLAMRRQLRPRLARKRPVRPVRVAVWLLGGITA
jgi:hypothetical protein